MNPARWSVGVDEFWAPGIAAARAGWLAGIAAFALYAATSSSYVFSADPAQFQTMARTGGIAHAGYPTIVLLFQLAALVPFGTLALKANLVSAIAGAIAVGLTAYAGARLTRSAFAGATAAVAFALSLTLWQESTLAGVHSFTLALDAAVFLLALRFAAAPTARLAAAIGLLFGIALTSHLTCLSLLFPLGVVLALVARRGTLRAGHLGAAFAGLLVGLTPFLYLLAMDQASQPMNYIRDTIDPALVPFAVDHPTPAQRGQRFAWLLTGRQYLEHGGLLAPHSVRFRFELLAIDLVLNEFPLVGSVLVAVGLVLLARRRDAVALALAAWLAGAVFFVAIGAVSFMVRIFFLPGALVCALALAVTLAGLRRAAPAAAWLAALLVVLAPIARATGHLPLSIGPPGGRIAATARLWPEEWDPFVDDRSWDAFGRGVMARVEPRAVILSCWQTATTMRYFVHGEPLRPDVEVAYACDFAPRFQRMARAAEAAGRPVYANYEPSAELLGGGTAEHVWTNGRGTLWRVHLPAAADSGQDRATLR